MRNHRRIPYQSVVLLALLLLAPAPALAENIDPDEDGSQYAYAENVGWVNAGERAVHIAHHEDPNGFILQADRLKPLHHFGCLNRVGGASDV